MSLSTLPPTRRSLWSLLAPIVAALVLLAGACHGPHATPSISTMGSAGAVSGSGSGGAAAVIDASADAATSNQPLDVIQQAYRDITGSLFRATTPRELLAPAWHAIALEANRQGQFPDLSRHEALGSDSIDAFTRELASFLSEPEAASLDTSRLQQAAVRAMAAAVGDSHTRFLTPAQVESQRRAAEGDDSYSGIGIRLAPLQAGGFTIAEVFAHTPADLAGLRAGDRIVSVNGKNTASLSATDFSAEVRGPEGTAVVLTVAREGEETRDVTVNRAKVAVPTVSSRLLGPGVGYIRISSFPRKSNVTDAAAEFDGQLAALMTGGARGIVVDLRGNPGGDPFTSVAVASNFVPDGPIFVSVDRDGHRTTYPAASRPTVFRGPVAVLVDAGTASGAEVVASALQESGAGYLIGTRSCGCLSVGKPLALGDASGLMVTVEQALTGRGERSLEGIGLQPDERVIPSQHGDAQMDAALNYLHARIS